MRLRRCRLRLLAALLVCTASAHAQGYNSFRSYSTSLALPDFSVQQNRTILYHQLSWSGTVTGCTASVDSSVDGINWTVGGIVPATSCSVPGIATLISGVSANFIRVNVTALASGTVNLIYTGWSLNSLSQTITGSANGTINGSQNMSDSVFSAASQNGSANGGSFNWRDIAGNTINVINNPFSNRNQPSGNAIGLTSTSCPGTTWGSGVSVTGMLLVYDKVGDLVYSAQNTQVTSGTGFCSTVAANPVANVPGAFAVQFAACTGAGCGATLSNFSILSKSATLSSTNYGPFTLGSFPLQFVANTIAATPGIMPADTQGLIVNNIHLHLGTNTFLTSVPWVTGNYSSLDGDTSTGTQVLLSLASPNAGHQLMEPWGALIAAGAGTNTHSETVAFGLYDSCGGSAQMISLGPLHTFPPFTAAADQINVMNPGIPAAPAPWNASTKYWGSAAACAGERIAVNNANGGKLAILRATVVGVNSATQPVFDTTGNGGVCGTFTAGTSTCPDGGQIWKVEALWGGRLANGTTYTVGSITTGCVWDSLAANLGVWCLDLGTGTSCVSGTQTNTQLFGIGGANLGDVVTESSGTGPCKWMFIGGQFSGGISALIAPGFGVFSADCTPNQTVGPSGLKQCSGGGATNNVYLGGNGTTTGLHISSGGVSGVQYNWSGCTDASVVLTGSSIKANCDAHGQAGQVTVVAGTGGGAIIPSQLGALSNVACPTTIIATCNYVQTIAAYIVAVFFTPEGPISQTVEVSIPTGGGGGFVTGVAVTGSAPLHPPDNAAGYMIYASSGAFGSGNELMQQINGVDFVCTTYVQSPLYGELCDLNAGWQINNFQTQTKQLTALSRIPATAAGEYMISLGGPMILPQYPGGAYSGQLAHILFEGAKSLGIPEPNLWVVVNQSTEEQTAPDDILASDALQGDMYCFSTGCQNSGSGYFHTVGQQSDYTIDFLIEGVTAFHKMNDWSCGGGLGNQWLARSGVMLKTGYIAQSPLSLGLFFDPQCEAVIEGVTDENADMILLNRYGRGTVTDGRSAVWGLHVDQYSANIDAQLVWCAAAGTCNNIQDDVVTPVPTATVATTTNNVNPTTMYYRDAGTTGGVGGSGPATPNSYSMNSDPNVGFLSGSGVAFANLGTAVAGRLEFCTNCVMTTPATCPGTAASCVCTSGTGSAWARAENFGNNGLNWYCGP